MLPNADLIAERYQIGSAIHRGPGFDLYAGEDLRAGTAVLIADLGPAHGLAPGAATSLRRLPGALRPGSLPGIAGVLAVEDHQGTTVVVYEWGRGARLSDRLEAGDLSADERTFIAHGVAKAVAQLHAKGLVHGGLTPQWVLITQTGKGPSALVAGVGTAGLASANGQGGAASYAAPERRRGADALPQSDVYAFGAILYHMVEGRAPAPFPQPAQPGPHSEILARCLAPKVEERFQSGEALAGRVARDLALPRAAPLRRPTAAREPDGRRWWKPWASRGQQARPAVSQPGPAKPGRLAQWREERAQRGQAAPAAPARPAEARKPGHPLAGFLVALILPLLIGLPLWGLYHKWYSSIPDDEMVPRVVGRTVDEARALLEKRGLVLAIVDETYDPEIPEGQIVWARPPAGRKVKSGRTVRVRVSQGAQAIEVPEVTHLKLETAKKRLEEAGLICTTEEAAHSDIVAEGAVISQSPRAGRKIREGSSVLLMLSKGPRADAEGGSASTGTDASKLPASRAHVRFEVPVGDVGQRVQILVIDATGEKTLYDALHEPGDTVEQDVTGRGQSKVRVLLDGRTVHEESL